MSTLWSISQGLNFELTPQTYKLFPYIAIEIVNKSHFKCNIQHTKTNIIA